MNGRELPLETADGLRDRLLAGAADMGVDLPVQSAARLLDYLRLLDKWNAKFNLSAVGGLGEMLGRHLLDSLSIAPWINGGEVVDAGSGAGLPGIPLAVLYPEKRFALVDSNGKKTRFLFQAKTELGLANVDVAQCRIEQYRGPADLVVCRALAGLEETAAKTRHLLSSGAMLVAMRGRHPGAEELSRLPQDCAVAFVNPLQVPGAGCRHVIGIRHRGPEAERT